MFSDLEKAGRIHSSSEQQQQLRLQEEELRKIQERILDEQLRFSEQQKVSTLQPKKNKFLKLGH